MFRSQPILPYSVFQYAAICLVLTGNPAFAQPAERAELLIDKQYSLSADRTLVLAVPLSWQDYPLVPDKASPPTIQFRGTGGQPFDMLLVFPPVAGAAAAPPDRFNKAVLDAAETIKLNAPEKSPAIASLAGSATKGSYAKLSHPASSSTQFRYLTQGELEIGDTRISFSILTNDGQATVENAALEMLRTARVSSGQASKDGVPPIPDPEKYQAIFSSQNYAILDSQISIYQDAYRNGTIGDEELLKAFLALPRGSRYLQSSYDQWVSQKPDSYVGRLARARYFVEAGIAARGTDFASGTAAQRFESMRDYFRMAMEDLELSLKLDAKPVLSYATMIVVAQGSGSHEEAARYLVAALALDVRAFAPRWNFLSMLRPEWGGSLQQMQLAVDSWKSRLDDRQINRLLRSIDDSKWKQALRPANDLVRQMQYKEAIVLLDRALEQAPVSRAYAMRAYCYKELGQYEKSVADYTRAIETDPDNDCGCESRQGRAHSYLLLGDAQRALPDLISAAKDNDSWAMGELAAMYAFGKYGMKPDQAAAQHWCNEAAEHGNADGLICVAAGGKDSSRH
jgi:tetratricopeptide (TPR) repeat protein